MIAKEPRKVEQLSIYSDRDIGLNKDINQCRVKEIEVQIPSESAMNRRYVKNFLLAPKAQLKIAVWIFTNSFIFATLLYVSLLFIISSLFFHLTTLIPPSVWTPGPELQNARDQLWIVYGLFTIASMLGSFLVAIKISHGYLGPMQSMRRYLRSLIDGSVAGPLALRKGDQTELVPEFNELARKMYPEKFRSYNS